MEFHSLINAIFSIEKMAESEGQPEKLVVQLHKLSKQIDNFLKDHQTTIKQNKESQKQRQQLRKKLRKTIAKLEKKEQECEQLKCELDRTKDMYDYKINKLLKSREERSYEPKQSSERRISVKESKKFKSKDIQCQILNESLVKELQQRNLCLLRKVKLLEEELEEQKNENNSKQLYIQSLLTALDGKVKEEVQGNRTEISQSQTNSEANCEDVNDISTIDADSLKGEDQLSEIFPEGERKVWHESELQGKSYCEGWYSSMENAFKRVKSWIWRV